MSEMEQKLQQVCNRFRIEGTYQSYEQIKMGNINQTYKVNFKQEDGRKKSYIVQRINTFVFKNPEQVMHNIDCVTEHIRGKKTGGVTLHFHHTADRKTYVNDADGFWRLTNFIPSVTFNENPTEKVMYHAGRAFGEFQMQLGDFDAAQLYTTIPDFHNTRKRLEKLFADAAKDPCGRAAEVKDALDYIRSAMPLACKMTDMQEAKELPLRVTHNDTKINNVLFDGETSEALTVVDLDTVMPGLVGHDFGDAVRFACNTQAEDSRNTELVSFDLVLFEAFTRGFLSQTKETLTETELNTLALSAYALTVELAARFLDDYILGDEYFKINYPEHNLVRTSCQLALAKDIEKKLETMNEIVQKCGGK